MSFSCVSWSDLPFFFVRHWWLSVRKFRHVCFEKNSSDPLTGLQASDASIWKPWCVSPLTRISCTSSFLNQRLAATPATCAPSRKDGSLVASCTALAQCSADKPSRVSAVAVVLIWLARAAMSSCRW